MKTLLIILVIIIIILLVIIYYLQNELRISDDEIKYCHDHINLQNSTIDTLQDDIIGYKLELQTYYERMGF